MRLTYGQSVVADSQQRGHLLIGLEQVTNLISRCRVYEILYLDDTQLGQALVNLQAALIALYAAMLRFLATANLDYDKNTASRAIRAVLKPDEVLKYIQSCRGLEKRVFKEAAICGSIYTHNLHTISKEQTDRLEQLLKELREPIVHIDDRVKKLWNLVNRSEQHDILCWISPVPYEENHRTARGERVPDTCQWLLMHQEYCQWRRSSVSSMLWLHGIRESPFSIIVSELTKPIDSWSWQDKARLNSGR